MAFTFRRQACSSGPAVEQIAKAQTYVLERLAVGLTMEGPGFKTRYRCPERVIKEAIINAVARSAQDAKLPPAWNDALAHGRMAVVSGVEKTNRLTLQLATERNALVARLAHSIVVAHTSLPGSLSAQTVQWQEEGRRVDQLVEP